MTTRLQSAGDALIDADKVNHIDDPSHVAALSGGGFVVAYDDIDRGIYARVFDANGAAQGAEFFVAKISSVSDFALTGLASGGFALSWVDSPAGAQAQLKAQIYDSSGSPAAGGAITVGPSNVFAAPVLAPLASGGFVLVERTQSAQIVAHLFDAAGAPAGPAINVASAPSFGEYGPDVVALPGGGFAVSWYSFNSGDAYDVYLRRFDAAGAPTGDAVTIAGGPGDQFSPHLLALSSGAIVAAWSQGEGPSENNLYTRLIGADGTLGAASRLNVSTLGDQREPTLAALPDGGYVIGWQDDRGQGLDRFATSIRAVRYDSAGARVGEEFDLNGYKIGYELRPELATLADGTLALVYTTFDNDFPAPLYGSRLELIDLVAVTPTSGGETADTLTGGAGADDLLGNGGDDVLAGAAGSDFLSGGEGNDVLDGGASEDRVEGGAGADRLTGGLGDDLVLGGDGDDILTYSVTGALGGVDRLEGGAGNDSFIVRINPYQHGEAGVTLDGGDGNDSFVVDWGSSYAFFTDTQVILDAGTGDDRVEIGSGEGGELITLGAGADTLVLTEKYGEYRGNSYGSLVVTDFSPAAGDRLDLEAFIPAYVFAWEWDGESNTFGEGRYFKLEQKGADTILVSRYSLTGDFYPLITFLNVQASSFTAATLGGIPLDGSPLPGLVLTGGAGVDTLRGGLGPDTIDGLGGDDALYGGYGADLLRGGDGKDSLTGGGGADRLEGGAGNDSLYGEAGNDRLDGGPGADGMEGGDGDDTYVVDDPSDSVYENFLRQDGFDTIESSVGYTLPYGVERLVLTGVAAIDGDGNGGDDILVGNDAANTLRGQGGNDLLDGAGGADVLKGGAGNDVYLVGSTDDTVVELAGEGVDEVRTGLGSKTDYTQLYVLPDNVENLTGTSASAQGVRGNGLDNVVTMGGGNDLIVLDDGGNDRASGGGGNDFIYYGA
ncbi:MAG: hypothetical protein JO238_02135, partial [Alphaproteobacteria bacterium]|nr:hypothetical protein [Alphaproteobacteria bacterium]